MRVWMIDEGSRGHRVQSEGVLAALEGAGAKLETARVDCRERGPGAFRPLARAAMDAAGAAAAGAVARAASVFRPPDGPPPELIVASGGTTAFALRALARRSGAFSVFVGNPKPFPGRWFDAVMTPIPLGLEAGREIVTDVVPSPTTPERLRAAAAARWPEGPPAPVWTLLVGGDSRNHRFSAGDFAALAEGANALAARAGVRWLVTTSPRTGAAGEAILAERLRPEAVAELTLFGRRPDPVTAAYLGAADRTFVTQDSLTMLSEALLSGRAVTALAPSDVSLDPENFMARLLRRWDAWPHFARLSCAALAELEIRAAEGARFDAAPAALARAARALLDRLAARGARAPA